MIKKGAVWKNHFDENLDFKFLDKDSMNLGIKRSSHACGTRDRNGVDEGR